MRIAVASIGLDVADKFRHSRNINYYTTRSLEIDDSKNIPTEGLPCERYAELMDDMGVAVVICGTISPSCRASFDRYGIEVVDGASGNALEAAQGYTRSLAQEESL